MCFWHAKGRCVVRRDDKRAAHCSARSRGPSVADQGRAQARVRPPAIMPRTRDTPRFDEAASDARAGLCETAQHFKYMLTTLRKDWCQPRDYERLQSAVKETYEWLYKNTQTAKQQVVPKLFEKYRRTSIELKGPCDSTIDVEEEFTCIESTTHGNKKKTKIQEKLLSPCRPQTRAEREGSHGSQDPHRGIP